MSTSQDGRRENPARSEASFLPAQETQEQSRIASRCDCQAVSCVGSVKRDLRKAAKSESTVAIPGLPASGGSGIAGVFPAAMAFNVW
jgi:hypothetical protein